MWSGTFSVRQHPVPFSTHVGKPYRRRNPIGTLESLERIFNERPDGTGMLLVLNHGDMSCRRDAILRIPMASPRLGWFARHLGIVASRRPSYMF